MQKYGGGVMEDLKSGIEHLRQAKAHMSKANGIMSNCISKLRELEEENAGLRAKLEALIQSDDSYMKLPLDADGVPIRIGDKVNVDGDCMTMLGYRLLNGELLLMAKKMESDVAIYSPKPSSVRHFKPEPPDSWEKLEEDAMGRACELAGSGNLRCGDCEWGKEGIGCQAMARLEILKRAKKLAGIEDLEGGER